MTNIMKMGRKKGSGNIPFHNYSKQVPPAKTVKIEIRCTREQKALIQKLATYDDNGTMSSITIEAWRKFLYSSHKAVLMKISPDEIDNAFP